MYFGDTARIVCHTLHSFEVADEQGMGGRQGTLVYNRTVGRYDKMLDTPEQYAWSSDSMNFPCMIFQCC